MVVDNASQDGSAAAIGARFPEVQVVARADRAGYGANQNLAIDVAQGRHVLMLNDDTLVQPGAIDALARRLDAEPDAAIAAPTVRKPTGELERTLWPRPSVGADVMSAVRLGRPPQTGRGPIGWVTGCALMARREALAAVGGFDEGFFMYAEEIDLCSRLLDAGHRIIHVPEAIVVHAGQVSTGATSPERAVEISRSRRRYWRKHYGPLARVAAQAIVGAQLGTLALAAALRRRPARPLLLEAAGCFRELGRPGLRERADDFNERRRQSSTSLG